jgi:hypothetical protein
LLYLNRKVGAIVNYYVSKNLDVEVQHNLLSALVTFNLGLDQRVFIVKLNNYTVSLDNDQLGTFFGKHPHSWSTHYILSKLSPLIGGSINERTYSLSSLIIKIFLKLSKYEVVPNIYNKFFFSKSEYIYLLDKTEDESQISTEILQLINSLNLASYWTIKIVSLRDGFDFLSWSFMIKKSGELVTYPHDIAWSIYKNHIKQIIKKGSLSLVLKLYRINCIAMYWRAYNHFCSFYEIRKKMYSIRLWCNVYFRKKTKFIKLQRILILQYLFCYRF